MYFLYSLSLLCACNLVLVSGVGPAYPPTKGGVWPKPRTQIFHRGYYTFDPEKFNVEITRNNCTILANRIRHYIYLFKQMKQLSEKYKHASTNNVKRAKRRSVESFSSYLNIKSEAPPAATEEPPAQELGGIHTMRVDLEAPCEDYPHLDMDESYNLTVTTFATLSSVSLWGIIRGLETFSQLFYFTDDFQEIRIDACKISDEPAYAHRGLLLDTARHFVPVRDILTTLEAMAINKMNVFHWHIVDDQSFPYQSEKFPDLSLQGAYHPSLVYTRADVETILKFATERGVRVVPEFDAPGHTQSWGQAYPNLLTECFKNGRVTGLGPMNPIRNTTYKFLRDLFQEVQDLFPDRHIHVGGDEVQTSCWLSNPEIQDWMKQQNVINLQAHFMSRFLPLLQPRSEAIVWQEVFDEGVPLNTTTIIQVWQNWNNPWWHMYKALIQGYRVLFSSFWYLDHLDQTFEKMLATDPREEVSKQGIDVNLDNVIGGEACMWGELVDDTNLHSRVWPRASAVAERLWSGPPAPAARGECADRVLRRAEEHACRMRRRAVPAAPPAGPGYCLV